MKDINSKYRLEAILGMVLVTIISIGMIVWSIQAFYEKYSSGKSHIIFPFFVLVTLLMTLLILVITNTKSVKITDHYIKFRYAFLPFITTKIQRKDIDGYTTVMEKRNTVISASGAPVPVSFSDKEAIWIFTNGKLKLRLSSIFYKNYDDLKNGLNNLDRIKVKADNSFVQLLYMTGLRKIKN